MKVVELQVNDLSNISANLRRLADNHDASKDPATSCIVVFGRGRDLWVNGFGQRVSGLEAAGWLARALFDVAAPDSHTGDMPEAG